MLQTAAATGKCQAGAVYLALLIVVAVTGASMASFAQLYSATDRHQKGVQLAWIQQQFDYAVRSYYFASPGEQLELPASINDLLRDTRFLTVRRHIRKMYIDPYSGQSRWGWRIDSGRQQVHIFSLHPEARDRPLVVDFKKRKI